MMPEVNDAPDNEVSLTDCWSAAARWQIFPRLQLGESRYKTHSPFPGQRCRWELQGEASADLLKDEVLLKINLVHTGISKVNLLFSSQQLKTVLRWAGWDAGGSHSSSSSSPCSCSPAERFGLGREGAAAISAKASAGFSAAPHLGWHSAGCYKSGSGHAVCLLPRHIAVWEEVTICKISSSSTTRGCKIIIAPASHARPGSVTTQAFLFPKQRKKSAFKNCRAC